MAGRNDGLAWAGETGESRPSPRPGVEGGPRQGHRGGAWLGPRFGREGLAWAMGETSLDTEVLSGTPACAKGEDWERGQGHCHPSRPRRLHPPGRGGTGSTQGPGPRPSPTPGSHQSRATDGPGEGDASSGGALGPGRGPCGLYHGGGGGGGPGPGVSGSPPRSRARRFHFPGCPGVNIRVSAPLPPRRAAATFLPRPGPARARPPRRQLAANERAGLRRSPSMESGAGGGRRRGAGAGSARRGGEQRGSPAGGPGPGVRGSGRRGVRAVGGPVPDSGPAAAGVGEGTAPHSPRGRGCGRHRGCEATGPLRPTPCTRSFLRRTRNCRRALPGPAQPSPVRGERAGSWAGAQRCCSLRRDLERRAAPEPGQELRSLGLTPFIQHLLCTRPRLGTGR